MTQENCLVIEKLFDPWIIDALPVLKDPALRVTAQKVRKVNKKKSQAAEFTGAGLAWWPWKVGYSRRA
ncbi:MAG TPA: hypothetical protein VFX58_03845 [Chitinophagaceae bacterium]|nr:hypothetical protein [Chitinophagaceae bacterium]